MKRNKREHGIMNPKKPDLPPQAINMDEKGSAEDEALIAQLLHGFDQMDLTIRDPEPPTLLELEQLVNGHRQKLRKQAALEWALFLIIALVIIGGNLLLASSSFVIFVVIQGIVFVGVIAIALRTLQKSRKKVKSGHA
ncbi:YxlC family protein [Paenibacillus dokdonensis]|uniref:YxlC family protein n=1 Tax=Paenibacillus dokdonensis TaxID=2567944 RepID=UPI0010A7F2F1|nr:YxlC family protein [Paenibacillus dokdonensis]